MNKIISELYDKIDAQDKIINTQTLEIARLKALIKEYKYELGLNEFEHTTIIDTSYKEDYKKYKERIDKAIEYITSNLIQNDITIQDYEKKIKELLEILGDKENE